jgi:hypothetical protein
MESAIQVSLLQSRIDVRSRLHELLNFWRFVAKPLGILRRAIKD